MDPYILFITEYRCMIRPKKNKKKYRCMIKHPRSTSGDPKICRRCGTHVCNNIHEENITTTTYL